MTWVKICGITNLEDALTAVDAGADAVGFVFYEKSPRNVGVQTVREIVAKLPEHVEKLGVFVEESVAHIQETADRAGLTGLQLYHCEAPGKHVGNLNTADRDIVLVLSASALLDDRGEFGGGFFAIPSKGERILFDAGNALVPGGTGQTFNWAKMMAAIKWLNGQVKTIVAGGLNPANVSEAMRLLNPWGVDVASGVEASPGKKDPEKVRAFIAAVREADKLH